MVSLELERLRFYATLCSFAPKAYALFEQFVPAAMSLWNDQNGFSASTLI